MKCMFKLEGYSMKRELLVALVLAANLVTSALRGELDNPSNHPHLVEVNIRENGQFKRCGGSIISANWVLTSAHCLFYPPDSRGSLVIHQPTEVIVTREYKRNYDDKFKPKHSCRVSELIIPREYQNQWNDPNRENQTQYDLGLVRLQIPNDFANSSKNSVKLAGPTDSYNTSQCVLAGWNQQVHHPQVHKATLVLQYQDGVYKSQLDMNEMDGYPVLCATPSNSMIQVAVVSRYSMMTIVRPTYQWIQYHLLRMSGGLAEHQLSESAQNPSQHHHSGSNQRPSSPVRPSSPAVNRIHLVIVSFVRNGQRKQCGGSIITENFVITSARCMFNSTRSNEPFEKYLPSEVTVSSEYKKSSGSQFQPTYESKALEIIPHNNYLAKVEVNYMSEHEIGLIRLESPIDFERFPSLGTVKLTGSAELYQMDGCVMERFNSSYHRIRIPVILDESTAHIFTSQTMLEKKNQGNPVLCPNILSRQMEQVAVVGNPTIRVSKFAKISFNYKWIQHRLGLENSVSNYYSFHSHLVIVSFKHGNHEKRCSGSVIYQKFVLTAAHCFYSSPSVMFNKSQTTVRGGFHVDSYIRSRYSSYNNQKALQLIPHKDYRNDSPERDKFDIGLVKFGQKQTRHKNYMIPIQLADSVEKLDLSRCLWAGWPVTSKPGIRNLNTSLEVSKTDSPQIFTSRPVFPYNNDQNQGGPVLCLSKSGPRQLKQVAVAIHTNQNGYQYLEVPFHLQWIQSIIGRHF